MSDVESGEASSSFFTKRKLAVLVVIVLVVVGTAGFYVIPSYEQQVVSTTVVSGKITGINASIPAVAAVPGVAQGGAIPALGPKPTTGAITYVTISVSSGSFTQILACATSPYYSGQTVRVADQTLRNGQHQYVPDVACKGEVSPFRSLQITTTTSSST